MDSDDISQTNTNIGSNNTVDAGHAVIEIVIGEDDENSVFSLLSLDEDGITSEKTECLHRV
jgi:hypothetical protein